MARRELWVWDSLGTEVDYLTSGLRLTNPITMLRDFFTVQLTKRY